MFFSRRSVALRATTACLIGALGSTAYAGARGATGIVASIENAPIVANGDVTGAPTDYLITLDGSLDPQVAGRGLQAGSTIRLLFPPEFDLSDIDPAYPLNDVPFPFPPVPPLPDRPCVPGNLQCTTVILLKGWPQDPLFPPVLFTTLSVDVADNALVLTAVRDIDLNPGIKQIHLILNGVRNPAPGAYRLKVEAQTGPNGALETGEGLLKVRRSPAPSINPTAVFVKALSGQLDGGVACGPGTNPPNPDNPIFQTTSVGTPAPFAWTFLTWGANAEPLDDLKLVRVTRHFYKLVRTDSGLPWWRRVVGYVRLSTPPGARHMRIEQIDCDRFLPATPVIGATPGVGPQLVGRLDLQFTAGDQPGVYRAKLWLRNGNRVEMTVIAD
ncbi:MAG: hypothetical protein AAF918_19065 [Pseudomonadota bacterium]